MERGCVAATSRSTSELRAVFNSFDAPNDVQPLRLVEDDTAALQRHEVFHPLHHKSSSRYDNVIALFNPTWTTA